MILETETPRYHVWRGPDQTRYTIWIHAHFYRANIQPPKRSDPDLLYAGNDMPTATKIRDQANQRLGNAQGDTRAQMAFSPSLFTNE